MTDNHDSMNQNRHGVNLTTLEEGDIQRMDCNFRSGRILDINIPEDEFRVRVGDAYQSEERTVNGDFFLPNVTELDDHLTPDELEALEDGPDVVVAYLQGHETTSRVLVDEVDVDNDRVAVTGECFNQSIGRWVDRKLVRSPFRDD